MNTKSDESMPQDEVKMVMADVVTGRITNLQSNLQAPDHLSRQEKARIACVGAGIIWPETILPPGTALWQSGVDKLKSDRAGWRRLPLAGEVIGLVQEALKAEDRRDFPQDVKEIRLRPSDGRIVRRQNLQVSSVQGLGYGPHTLRQLVAQIDPLDDAPRGFASALLYLDDQERAEILNRRLARMDGQDENIVTLRTRLPHYGDGSRIARAALSTIYGSVTDHDIAGAIGEMLKGDLSGRLDYKPGDARSRFEIIWPSDIPIETFVVGDVHYAALSVTNSETGEGSLDICPAVIRARCANLTVSTGEGTKVSIRHVGDAQQLMIRLKAAIRMALDSLEPLLMTITAAGKIKLVDAWTPEKAFAAIARKYALPAASVPVWMEQKKQSQYPDTVWGLSAAISEAAHGRDSWTDSADWERVSSEVQAKAVSAAVGGAHDAFGKAVSAA